MRKWLIVLSIVLAGFFVSSDWDIIFTFLQHQYYRWQDSSAYPKQSRIETVTASFRALDGGKKSYKVYLPKGYYNNPGKRYPSLYLLHGFPGENSDWLINANLEAVIDRYVKEKILPPLIVVFPDGNGPLIRDGQYVNATEVNQAMESYILELVGQVDRRYSTLQYQKYRAIGGLSSGAYGAVNIGLRHQNLFGLIISHSGYFINNEPAARPLLGSNREARRMNNPLDYINGLKLSPDLFIYLDIGKNDKQSYLKENMAMDALLKTRSIRHVFNITAGGHGWPVWRQNIHLSLRVLGSIWSPKP